MRVVVAAIALITIALIGSGCSNPRPAGKEKPGEARNVSASNNISANSIFGPVNIRSVPDLCAGRVQLVQGSATVNDACFTGDTNVVLCTDATAANAIRCAAAKDNLQLTGTGNDLINYARVR